jgi:hypothetical protein
MHKEVSFLNLFSFNLKPILETYSYSHFKIELELFGFDLKNNLTININGKYI